MDDKAFAALLEFYEYEEERNLILLLKTSTNIISITTTEIRILNQATKSIKITSLNLSCHRKNLFSDHRQADNFNAMLKTFTPPTKMKIRIFTTPSTSLSNTIKRSKFRDSTIINNNSSSNNNKDRHRFLQDPTETVILTMWGRRHYLWDIALPWIHALGVVPLLWTTPPSFKTYQETI
jgi:hypothetical protein